MKILMAVLILTLLHSVCSQSKTNKERKGKKDRFAKFYINNWTQYKIPVPVDADSMREILQRIALYKALQYCPFDGIDVDACVKKGIVPVVKAIISDIVKEKNKAIRRFELDEKALIKCYKNI
ncbi:uncharacterized protein LOC123875976 isoform X2 [Maniola jurtina]|uniref:uncharacterized protein LOC123875976 isoform X2 n=1 Tax=Maniola jurtina TaxID=191418 RepID=UPI001E687D60|nr:uncharacterized protein LOC123875976 isoform X2 [Maniola jurtina]